MVSDSGLHFWSKLFHAIYKLQGMRKTSTSSYHPNGNDVERVNHTMAQMPPMVVNKKTMNGTLVCRTWNFHSAVPSVPPPGWLRTSCTWIAPPAYLSSSSSAGALIDTKAPHGTSSSMSAWSPTASDARLPWLVNDTLLIFPVSNAAVLRCPNGWNRPPSVLRRRWLRGTDLQHRLYHLAGGPSRH